MANDAILKLRESEEFKAKVTNIIEACKANGIKENVAVVRVQPYKGMEFTLESLVPDAIETDGKKGDPFLMITTSAGARLSPKFFANIEDDPVEFGTSLGKLTEYVLLHAELGTTFKIEKYKAASGTFNTDSYKPTTCEISIA